MVKSSVALILLVLVACDPKIPTRPPVPNILERVVVQHILIAFDHGRIPKVTRGQAEAEQLATEVLGKVKAGENFAALMKKHSDDTGGGTYKIANKGLTALKGEQAYDGMVPGFSAMAFSLKVKEIGMVEYHPDISPFGWHIVQRIE